MPRRRYIYIIILYCIICNNIRRFRIAKQCVVLRYIVANTIHGCEMSWERRKKSSSFRSRIIIIFFIEIQGKKDKRFENCTQYNIIIIYAYIV